MVQGTGEPRNETACSCGETSRFKLNWRHRKCVEVLLL